MNTIQSIKVITISVMTVATIALFALLIQAGMSPVYALLTFLALAAIAYATYVFSDWLLIAVMGASTRDVPTQIKSMIKQYCEREHIPVPLAAVVREGCQTCTLTASGRKKRSS